MHRYPLLILTVASLSLSFGACTSDPNESTVADPRDDQAVAAWLARPHKSCSLSAVYPHRESLSGSLSVREQGLDRALILKDADANGFRRFDDNGYAFARFARFGQPVGGDTYDEDHVGDSAAGIASAELRFEDGVCHLTIDGEEVFTGTLHESVTVDVASWPEMRRVVPNGGQSSVSPPELVDGFEWLDPAPRLYSRVYPTGSQDAIATQVAAWLDDADQELASRVVVQGVSGMLLELADADWFPPLVLGDGLPTLVSTEERERFAAVEAVVWRWLFVDSADQLTVIELSGVADQVTLRYIGVESRDGAAAQAQASRCFTDIFGRILDGRLPSTNRGTFPNTLPTLICAAHDPKFLDAAWATPDAFDIALHAFTEEARQRYGLVSYEDDIPIYYEVVSELLLELVARALIGDLPAADLGEASSQAYRDARYSLASLRGTSLFNDHPELELPLTKAVLTRALYDHYLPGEEWLAQDYHHSTPPLSAKDAAAFAAEAALVQEPYTTSMIGDIVASVIAAP